MFSIRKNSIFTGMLLGLIPAALGYAALIYNNEIINAPVLMKMNLHPPRPQLIILAISIIIFRFMIVKWEMTETGKGFFITIFLAVIFYFVKQGF